MAHPSFLRTLPLAALLVLGACREGSEQGGTFVIIEPSPAGTQGCVPLTVALGPATIAFQSADFGELSQIAASSDPTVDETFYWTAEDGGVRRLILPAGGGMPLDQDVIVSGTIEAQYLLPAIALPASLSGIAVIDEQRLVVAEHASNTLVIVRTDLLDRVDGGIGLKVPSGGFSDGSGANISFRFTEPVPLLVDATDSIFVGDTGNNAVRVVLPSVIPESATIAGNGAPGDGEGPAPLPRFDTPSGIAASCAQELVLVESGAAGVAGHRLVSLQIREGLFGGFDTDSLVLAGDGTEATTQGVDTAAQLATPMGMASTAAGQLFWVDADGTTTGEAILRRYDFTTGLSDCPMFPDCATAVVQPSAFTGSRFSVVIGASGALYVLGFDDVSGTGTLWRVGT